MRKRTKQRKGKKGAVFFFSFSSSSLSLHHPSIYPFLSSPSCCCGCCCCCCIPSGCVAEISVGFEQRPRRRMSECGRAGVEEEETLLIPPFRHLSLILYLHVEVLLLNTESDRNQKLYPGNVVVYYVLSVWLCQLVLEFLVNSPTHVVVMQILSKLCLSHTTLDLQNPSDDAPKHSKIF